MTRTRTLVSVGSLAAAVSLAFVFSGACTNSYIYDERRSQEVPRDREATIEGEFCTPAPNAVVRPLKIFIVMDASQSMVVTDPQGSRATAVVQLLQSLPQEKEVSFVVMLFAGSTSAWLSKTGLAQFERVIDYTPDDMTQLEQRILNFAAPGTMANRDSTDFVKPLSDVFGLINRDIADTRLMVNNDDTRARYTVVFLSDGEPTNNQDEELLCGDAVRRVRQLKDLADDVTVNTVHVNSAIGSTKCDFDGGFTAPPSTGSDCLFPNLDVPTCPLLLVNQNAQRLQKMAELGGGDFRDFRNNEPINFLNFRFGQVRRTFVFDKIIASNFSAPADSPLDQADTDSDGLTDAEEDRLGTLPWVADTDGDGFSDGVEVFGKSRGANFTPNQVALPDGGGLDLGCPPELRGVDSDCDGLTDCDEQIVGTNAQRIDSDDDGVPDSIEFKLGSQAASNDLDQDPDNDQLANRDELSAHTNPLVVDSADLSVSGYRYEVVKDGGITGDGQQCFSFRISNVALANTIPDTRDAGNPDGGDPFYRRGAGYNDLFVSTSMKAGDDPTAHSSLRVFRIGTPRFPVGGIKSPHDGRIRIAPGDFVAGCKPAVPVTP